MALNEIYIKDHELTRIASFKIRNNHLETDNYSKIEQSNSKILRNSILDKETNWLRKLVPEIGVIGNYRSKNNSLCYNHYPQLSENNYSIEKLLGSKKRLHNLQAIRNGIQIISPGDKIYKSVEFEKDHFKLLSNEDKDRNSNNLNFYSDIKLIKESLSPDKLWKNRRIKESLESDSNYLKNLFRWEEKYLPHKILKK